VTAGCASRATASNKRGTVPGVPATTLDPSDLTLDPPAHAWPALLRTPPTDDRTRRFREQLGLPTDRPIVMSGHQVQFWHPGILAKLIAANELAARTGAAVAWMLVDHESPSPSGLHFPTLDPAGRLRARGRTLAPDGDRAPLTHPPFAPRAPELHAGWTPEPTVAPAIGALAHRLRAHSNEPDRAAQLTSAQFDRFSDLTPPPITLRVTDLARTDLFAEWMDRVRTDPHAVHRAYNNAAAAHPDSGVRALSEDAEWGVELPLWIQGRTGRRPAYSRRDLDADTASFIPRALPMTGLVRFAACDLFIHGLGGRAYEPVNDQWLDRWLAGRNDAGLAPFVTASADLRLVLEGDDVTHADARRAHWRAHHARHHPELLGDDDHQRRRDAVVRAIAAAPRHSNERGRLFAELHALLDDHARRHAAALDRRTSEARDLTRAAAERDVRSRRDWPAVLYPEASLRALRGAIRARFDG